MWEKYLPEHGADYVPPETWGKDHWSTFAYLETLTVDRKGVVQNAKMRCNNRLHREFATDRQLKMTKEYPTITKQGPIHKHDDWSCVEDMVYYGYITAETRQVSKAFNDNTQCRVALTPFGQKIAAELRQHKAAGGNFADFTPSSYTNYKDGA